jgi:hypothetical protein
MYIAIKSMIAARSVNQVGTMLRYTIAARTYACRLTGNGDAIKNMIFSEIACWNATYDSNTPSNITTRIRIVLI